MFLSAIFFFLFLVPIFISINIHMDTVGFIYSIVYIPVLSY